MNCLSSSILRHNSFRFLRPTAELFSLSRVFASKSPRLTPFSASVHSLFKPPKMESPDIPQSSTAEDFIHIENPKLCADSLSDSIVNVEEELPRENIEALGVDALSSQSSHDSSGASEASDNRLREELLRNVVCLSCDSVASDSGNCDVYLVGTAHVSLDSCKEVQAVISHLKPEAVFLELCSSRVAVLSPQNLKVPTFEEMIEMYKKQHNLFGILYSWFLAKVATKLEVFPGSEFRVAFEEARRYGADVILGDRPVQVTLKRTWAKMPLWHKAKLLFSLLFQSFFLPNADDLNKMLKDMDDVDMLTLVIQEMSKTFPTLMETLVHERDKYMSSKLLAVASEHASVVAVVGKGHLQGIKDNWKQPVQISDLMEIPMEKPIISTKSVLTFLGVGIAGVAILSGLYMSAKK